MGTRRGMRRSGAGRGACVLAAVWLAAGCGASAERAVPAATPATADAPTGAPTTEDVEAPGPVLPDADVQVDMYNYFTDAPAQVAAGSRVLVLNRGTALHDWVNRDGAFTTEELTLDEFEVVALDTPGTFDWVCSLHPAQMRGEIEVVDGPVAAPEPIEVDGTIHVEVTEWAFVGPVDQVPAGTDLTVTNIGDTDHDLVTEEGPGTDVLSPGESEVITLDTPGRFEWYCSLHVREMRRTVEVVPA